MIHVLFSQNKRCLISLKATASQNGCKTNMAFILTYLTVKFICQFKVAARKKKKECRPKLAASQNWPPEWMPANKRQDLIGWYPKLAVKIASQKKCVPAKIGCQPKSTTNFLLQFLRFGFPALAATLGLLKCVLSQKHIFWSHDSYYAFVYHLNFVNHFWEKKFSNFCIFHENLTFWKV